MTSETKTIKTPSGKEVILKSYLTARERNELRGIFLRAMKISPSGEQTQEISGEVTEQAEQKLIELAVISYDGSAENILERLLNSAPEEYDFVVAEANRISAGNFQKAE